MRGAEGVEASRYMANIVFVQLFHVVSPSKANKAFRCFAQKTAGENCAHSHCFDIPSTSNMPLSPAPQGLEGFLSRVLTKKL
jgi:hypothetical protein